LKLKPFKSKEEEEEEGVLLKLKGANPSRLYPFFGEL
jgi:hypothetical protein